MTDCYPAAYIFALQKEVQCRLLVLLTLRTFIAPGDGYKRTDLGSLSFSVFWPFLRYDSAKYKWKCAYGSAFFYEFNSKRITRFVTLHLSRVVSSLWQIGIRNNLFNWIEQNILHRKRLKMYQFIVFNIYDFHNHIELHFQLKMYTLCHWTFYFLDICYSLH